MQRSGAYWKAHTVILSQSVEHNQKTTQYITFNEWALEQWTQNGVKIFIQVSDAAEE